MDIGQGPRRPSPGGGGAGLLDVVQTESPVEALGRAGAPLQTVRVHVDVERFGEAVHRHVGRAGARLGRVEHLPANPEKIL